VNVGLVFAITLGVVSHSPLSSPSGGGLMRGVNEILVIISSRIFSRPKFGETRNGPK